MENKKDNDSLLNLTSIPADTLNITGEVNCKLRDLVAKLIDLNINQLENKISKDEAKKVLYSLVKDHFAIEEACAEIINIKKATMQSGDNQNQKQ